MDSLNKLNKVVAQNIKHQNPDIFGYIRINKVCLQRKEPNKQQSSKYKVYFLYIYEMNYFNNDATYQPGKILAVGS